MAVKRINKRVFLLFVFSSVLFSQIYGQKNNLPKKETKEDIIVRSSEQINDYLNNKDFLYNTELARTPKTLWQQFLYRIQQIIAEFFYLLEKGGNLVSYIFYAIILFVLIFIILKLLRLNPHHILLRSKKIKMQNLPVFEENINAVDFEKIITEAIQDQNYRKAVRFLYIQFLKILSQNEEIEWKKEKTNKDYKQEMKNSRYISEFSKLTKIYEYVWYGEFTIKEKFFGLVHQDFKQIFNQF